MVTIIRPVTVNDIESATETVDRAFSADPFFTWLHEGDDNIKRAHLDLDLTIKNTIRNGVALAAIDDGKCVGIALWNKPANLDNKSWIDWIDSWSYWFKNVTYDTLYGKLPEVCEMENEW